MAGDAHRPAPRRPRVGRLQRASRPPAPVAGRRPGRRRAILGARRARGHQRHRVGTASGPHPRRRQRCGRGRRDLDRRAGRGALAVRAQRGGSQLPESPIVWIVVRRYRGRPAGVRGRPARARAADAHRHAHAGRRRAHPARCRRCARVVAARGGPCGVVADWPGRGLRPAWTVLLTPSCTPPVRGAVLV